MTMVSWVSDQDASVSVDAIERDFEFVRVSEIDPEVEVFRRAGWIYGIHGKNANKVRRKIAFLHPESDSQWRSQIRSATTRKI